ncbi:MAG TPA: hypothetical protein VFP73_05450 [Terrabacter sp.]|nr:hypothetical protein [Terrabacter sp.]
MTTQTLAPVPSVRRTRLLAPAPRRRYLVPAVLAVVFVVTEGLAQALTPFIRNDDWPFLLPPNTHGVLPVSYYDKSEGRWLNTVWWTLVGQHGTVTTAAMTYALAYVVLVAGMWRVLHLSGIRPRPAVDALLGATLYASAVWVQLLYWPGTLTASVIVGAVAIWLLPWAARSRRRLALWLLAAEAAAVLTYPPVGVVLLVFTVLLLREAPWRRVLAVLATWLGAFALGVFIAYSLNWLLNGHFRLQLASWRHPNPLTSFEALLTNVGRWFSAVGDLWAAQWWLALVALAGIALGWRRATVRHRLERLLLTFAVALGLDAVQTLVTGVVTEPRGQLWTWSLAVLPAALLLLDHRERTTDQPEQTIDERDRAEQPARRLGPAARAGTALLAVLAVGGVLAWRGDIGEHQAVRQQYEKIATAATGNRAGADSPLVIVYQDPDLSPTRSGQIMASTLMMAVQQEQGGAIPRRCSPTECFEVAARLAIHPATGTVVPLGQADGRDLVAVVVPVPPRWL